MKPGPRAKPTALKKLAGNPGKKRLNEAEPKPVISYQPYAPRHLNEPAKKEWNRVVGKLIDLGLFTDLDHAALAMYCQAYGRWVMAENEIVETGGEILTSDKGNLYQNPWFFVSNKAFDQMRQMLQEFGFSPSSRTGIKADPKSKEKTLAELLFEGADG